MKRPCSMLAAGCAVTICLSICLLSFEAHCSNKDLILKPTKAAASEIDAANVFDIHVALRLPLTPPPGVQQPAANKGWYVALTREDLLNENGKPASVGYRFPIMRLRPVGGSVYRITVETTPWLPPGRYDLKVSGPGFYAESKNAVVKKDVSKTAKRTAPLRVGKAGELLIDGVPDGSTPTHVMLVVSKTTSGIVLRQGGERLTPLTVVPARFPEDGSRVAIFAVPPNSGLRETPSLHKLTLDPVDAQPCDVQIQWEPPKPNQILDWRNLQVETTQFRLNAVWDFGDGRHGEGLSVRHRFLLPNRAVVSVTAFDNAARRCAVKETVFLNPHVQAGGCGCSLVGR